MQSRGCNKDLVKVFGTLPAVHMLRRRFKFANSGGASNAGCRLERHFPFKLCVFCCVPLIQSELVGTGEGQPLVRSATCARKRRKTRAAKHWSSLARGGFVLYLGTPGNRRYRRRRCESPI